MKKAFLILIVVCILVIFYGIYAFKNEEQPFPTTDLIKVEITGAVNFPGEYFVSSDTTVLKLLNYAGGLKENALLDKLNYEEILKDNNTYHIPFIKHIEPTPLTININTATVEELSTLPGIGAAKALAIISYRDRNGPFTKKEDLMKVSGIGIKTYEELQDKISV